MQVHDHMIVLRENAFDVVAMFRMGILDPVEEVAYPVYAIGRLGAVLDIVLDQEFTQPGAVVRIQNVAIQGEHAIVVSKFLCRQGHGGC